MARGKLALVAGLLGVAAVAGGVVWRAFDRDMDAARARLAGRSQVIDSPWGAIEYAEAGSGPAVLMIHGSGGGFDQGLAFGKRMPGAGFRVIAPSRFGYLRSDFPAGASPEMQADALAHLLEQRTEGGAIIFGGSAGALSATQLALRHPQLCRGLVLVVPATYAPDRRANESAASNGLISGVVEALLGSDFLFWAAISTAPDFMTRMILATEPKLLRRAPEIERRRIRETLFGILPISARKRGLLMDGTTAGAPPPYPLDQVQCPILVISTRDDLYGTGKAAAYAAATARDARLVLYPTGGHMWVGHDDEVWQEITKFSQARPKPGRPIAGR